MVHLCTPQNFDDYLYYYYIIINHKICAFIAVDGSGRETEGRWMVVLLHLWLLL